MRNFENMKRKTFIIMLVALMSSIFCIAQNKNINIDIYEDDICIIEYVNTNTGYIRIGNQELKKGQRFYVSQTIHWCSDNHSLKVRNVRTGQILGICAKQFKNEAGSLLSWYIRTKKLDSKGYTAMKNLLSQTFYMIDDTIRIQSKLYMDDNHGYIVRSIPDNIEIILPFDDETNEIVISRQLLKKHGIQIENAPLRCHVEFWENRNPKALTDNMRIEYIPDILNCVP